MVSTTRGSIKKRFGSSAFASGTSATFPTNAVTDSFIRANENPLKKDGKGNETAWVVLPVEGADTGKIKSNVWEGLGVGEFVVEGGYYSVAEQTNPAVSIEVIKFPEITIGEFGPACCISSSTGAGYYAIFKEETLKGGKYKLTLVRKDKEAETTLATVEKIVLATKANIGIAVRAGIVSVWTKPSGGSYEKITEAADATYTKGYSGFRYRTDAAIPALQLKNFTTGEMPAATTTVEFTSLAAVNPAGTRYLIVSNGEKVYSCQTNGTLTEIGTGTAGTYWSIIQAEKGNAETAGPVYLSNGVDAPKYWTGAAANTPLVEWKSKTAESEEKEFVATPKAKYLVYAGNRVFAAGMTSEPSAVRFTETTEASPEESVPDPTRWPKHNVVPFDPEDGLPITGLGRVGPYVLVFKAHKTWVIYNLDEGSNRKLSDSTGCIAHRSIAESEAGTFFLTADQGVYVTNGSNLKEVSYNIRPTLLSINPAKREQAAGAYFNNHYYLSFATGVESAANRTADYDLTLKSWWLHDLTANQWTPFEANTGEPFLFIIPPVVGGGIAKAFDPAVYTDRTAVYTGNGQLSAWWISAWDPFAYYIFRHRVKAPMLKKRVRQIFFDGEGEIIPSVYRNFSVGERQEPGVVGNREISTEDTKPVDFASGTEKWVENEGVWGIETSGTEVLWGGETSVGSARLYSPGVARVWGVGYGNKSAQPFTVHSYAMMASFRKS